MKTVRNGGGGGGVGGKLTRTSHVELKYAMSITAFAQLLLLVLFLVVPLVVLLVLLVPLFVLLDFRVIIDFLVIIDLIAILTAFPERCLTFAGCTRQGKANGERAEEA